MRKTALVTGATSQLGVFLLPRLLQAGFQVRAVSRRAPAVPGETAEHISWLNPGDAICRERQAAAPGSGARRFLVSCGPLDLAREMIAGGANFERVVAFSSSSVISKKDSADRRESELLVGIAQQESGLRHICAEGKLPLLLLRPTLIYGCGLDRNISLLARLGNRSGFIPLAGKADGLRQPVHADDLARLAVDALEAEVALDLESPACGGSTLSYREMVEKVAASCPGRVRLLTLPPGLLAGAVRALSWLPPWSGLNAEMVRRQNRDLVFDDSALREALKYDPRPFQPTSADFQVPEYAKKLQLPKN